jgi:hypothetical protein
MGKILIFSHQPEKGNTPFDKSKPLRELSLKEDVNYPRKNPILFIISSSSFNVLLVVGGYIKKDDILEPLKTIKVFKLT